MWPPCLSSTSDFQPCCNSSDGASASASRNHSRPAHSLQNTEHQDLHAAGAGATPSQTKVCHAKMAASMLRFQTCCFAPQSRRLHTKIACSMIAFTMHTHSTGTPECYSMPVPCLSSSCALGIRTSTIVRTKAACHQHHTRSVWGQPRIHIHP